MRILVLQHSPIDHLGVMAQFFRDDGLKYDAINMHIDATLPDINRYSALIVMGGPQQTDEENLYPWLISEKNYIRRALQKDNFPVLGVCLGAQLIAEVAGGRVGPMNSPEIGILDVETMPDANNDHLLKDFPLFSKALQWHLNAIIELPPEATHLMRSPICQFQGFRLGGLVYGFQFHMEIDEEMVRGTNVFPEYVLALEVQNGPGALERLAQETEKHAAEVKESAKLIYRNFVRITSDQTLLRG